ncbi:hypothetical protein QQF64_004863 [Cirrhinus molitorella]
MFFLLGSLLLSMGLWILLSESTVFIDSSSYISISLFPYMLIVTGSVTMSLGFLGCLGSLKSVKWLLATYFILLTILLAAQIVGGVIFYTQKTELADELQKQTVELMKSPNTSLKRFKMTIEYIQQKVKCCGWNGNEDWDIVPCSCCCTGNTTVNANVNATVNATFCTQYFSDGIESNHTCEIYKQGCGENINAWLKDNLRIIFVVILAISAVEICGMILSMCLYKEGSVNYNTILH